MILRFSIILIISISSFFCICTFPFLVSTSFPTISHCSSLTWGNIHLEPGYGKRIISTNLLLFASSNFRISSRCLQLALAWRNKINNQFPSSFCLFVSSFLPIFLQVPTAPALVRRKYNNQFLFCLF